MKASRPWADLHSMRIQDGDTVFVVVLAAGLGGDEEMSQRATVIRVPAGVGDLWQFQRDDGSVFAINPYCPRFIRIEKEHSHV